MAEMNQFHGTTALIKDEQIQSWRQQLKALVVDIDRQMNETSTSLTLNFKLNKPYKKDSREMLESIRQNLSEIIATRKHFGSFPNESDVDESRELLIVLSRVVAVSETLMSCEECLNNWDIVGTSTLLSKASEEIKTLPSASSEVGSGDICKYLRLELSSLSDKYVAKVKELLTLCVELRSGEIDVQHVIGLHENGKLIELRVLWQCLQDSGEEELVIQALASQVWKYVLQPLWKLHASIKTEVTCSNVSSEFRTISSDSKATETTETQNVGKGKVYLGPSKVPINCLVAYMSNLIGFVSTEIFKSHSNYMDIFARALLLSPLNNDVSLMEGILDSVTYSLPPSSSDLSAFESELRPIAIQFESDLQRINLLPLPNFELSKKNVLRNIFGQELLCTKPLTAILDNIVLIAADRRHSDIVTSARDIIYGDYKNFVSSDDFVFEYMPKDESDPITLPSFGKCTLSETVTKICLIINSAFLEACSSSLEAARNLLLACRDIIAMFVSTIAVKYEDEMGADINLAVVFFNDFNYLLYCFLITGLTYKDKLAQVHPWLEIEMIFKDFPDYLERCHEPLRYHLNTISDKLDDCVKKINIQPQFDNSEEEDKSVVSSTRSLIKGKLQMAAETLTGALAKTALKETTAVKVATKVIKDNKIFEEVANDIEACKPLLQLLESLQSLQDVMSKEEYMNFLSAFVGRTVFQGIMEPILESDCITASACTSISNIIRTVCTCRSLFPSDVDIDAKIPYWTKFNVLADLLDYNLTEIADLLPKKKFSCFTGRELTKLINALFEDSLKRQNVIRSIEAMSK